MKPLPCIILIFLSLRSNAGLLDAHDFLFYHRIAHDYSDARNKAALLKQAEDMAAAPEDRPVPPDLGKFLYQQYYGELYYLRVLIRLDSLGDAPPDARIALLDKAISYFYDKCQAPEEGPLTKMLRNTFPVRCESVLQPKEGIYNDLVTRSNISLWSALMDRQRECATAVTCPFGDIRRIYQHKKLLNTYKGAEKLSGPYQDRSVLLLESAYSYFKVREAEKNNRSDSAVYFLLQYAVLKKLTDQRIYQLDTLILRYQADAGLREKFFQYQDKWSAMLTEKFAPAQQSAITKAAFPWPPPAPSSRSAGLQLNSSHIGSLGDADRFITDRLSRAGYGVYSYYYVPGGFALVTPLEQTTQDAMAKNDPPRWDVKVDLKSDFSFINYIKALFFGTKGYYRIMVFILTDAPFSLSNTPGAQLLSQNSGLTSLAREISVQPYTRNHRCTVLVYEFQRGDCCYPPKFINPAKYTARQHLLNLQLWQSLFIP